ncbi:hypothetical protein NQ314_004933 [Rhamnusium bicolor]|uniref:Phosphatidylinositol N-acetylglucosaminyltransferase subunit Q n=1 Tax=Rhamnusium bicolor TaxID=1586634 RepID=A0AAV8ZL03_9CUCU|nr:hypothetical protein NQ314_004933 [Rhamnusium bicolor]
MFCVLWICDQSNSFFCSVKITCEMGKNILIFKPNTLEKHKAGYLIGCYKEFEDCEAYYITDDAVLNNFTQCIGYVGKSLKHSKLRIKSLFINSCSGKIVVNNDVSKSQSILEIVYDYEGFKNSDIVYRESESYGKHFKNLTDELRKNRLGVSENGKKSMIKCSLLSTIFLTELILKIIYAFKPLLRYSATFLHFKESVVNLKWFLNKLVEEKKLTPKMGNAFVAKIIDLLIGIILLNWFLKYEVNILSFIETTIEDIITNLKGLLVYLMGSPIGLKLNYSFNKILGKFFFYHISLWRVFLLGMESLLTSSFKFLVLPGALGFSFQVAMFSDIVSIATFHVYCIYVYAAR